MKKIIRITTVPESLNKLLENQLRFINEFYEVIAVSRHGKDLLKIRDTQGIRVESINFTRKVTPLKDLLSIIRLYYLLKKEKPLFVHTHTPKAGFVGMIAAKLAKVPIKMHTVAGLPLMETTGLKRIILELTEKITYYSADRIYPNSFGLKKFIINNKFTNTKKIKVLGNGSSNGIDIEKFKRTNEIENKAEEIKKLYNVSNADIVYCFVGRVVKDKGIEELISAFQIISKTEKNIKLFLVGAFEEKLDPLSGKTLVTLKQNKNIIHVGFQDDIRPYLALSDIFVFPSYREGFPNVVLQAGCFDLPCIVSNINGCNEIIEEGINGIIVEKKNTEQLRRAMVELLYNKEKRNSLAVNAREKVINMYDQKIIWSELLAEYKNLELEIGSRV